MTELEAELLKRLKMAHKYMGFFKPNDTMAWDNLRKKMMRTIEKAEGTDDEKN